MGSREGRKKREKRRKRKFEKRGVGKEKKKKKVISYLKDRLLAVYCDQVEILFPLHTHKSLFLALVIFLGQIPRSKPLR